MKKFWDIFYKVYMAVVYTAIAIGVGYIAYWLYKVTNWSL
jgi:hypothetical protein